MGSRASLPGLRRLPPLLRPRRLPLARASPGRPTPPTPTQMCRSRHLPPPPRRSRQRLPPPRRQGTRSWGRTGPLGSGRWIGTRSSSSTRRGTIAGCCCSRSLPQRVLPRRSPSPRQAPGIGLRAWEGLRLRRPRSGRSPLHLCSWPRWAVASHADARIGCRSACPPQGRPVPWRRLGQHPGRRHRRRACCARGQGSLGFVRLRAHGQSGPAGTSPGQDAAVPPPGAASPGRSRCSRMLPPAPSLRRFRILPLPRRSSVLAQPSEPARQSCAMPSSGSHSP